MTRFVELLLPRLTNDPLAQAEAAFTLVALLAAFACWRANWLVRAERFLGSFARRRRAAVLAAGLAPLMMRALVEPFAEPHVPGVHDEFSYLLQAETLAAGRLTNPPHPLWRHFESFHIIQQPTYMSMHPIGQGMALAAGKVLFGHPWAGVFLSVGGMCAALCWMLQAWLPPPWALLGAMIAAVRFGLFSYWVDSYYGGALAAIGGALVIGSLGRTPRPRLAIVAGFAILAVTRPYEGVLLGLACLLIDRSGRLLAALAPGAVVIGAFLMYYCWRGTGDPLRLPYLVNRETYAVAPLFLWEKPRPAPVYRHAVMRDFYLNWESSFQLAAEQRTAVGYTAAAIGKFQMTRAFVYGPVFTIPLLLLPVVLAASRLRPLAKVLGVFFLGASLQIYFQPHYAAPILGLLLVFLLQALRRMRAWRWRGRRVGPPLVRGLALIVVAMAGLRLAAGPRVGPVLPFSWSSSTPKLNERARILRELDPGRHVIVVRYAPGHKPGEEWVYNEPDIDAARVVWAREMSDPENRELLRYFSNRTAWLLEPDAAPPRLTPYQPAF
jgi:hypothetical protein